MLSGSNLSKDGAGRKNDMNVALVGRVEAVPVQAKGRASPASRVLGTSHDAASRDSSRGGGQDGRGHK